MAGSPRIFAKIIVGDEEAMAAYYQAVYGLKEMHRLEGIAAATGERFREVIMSFDGTYATESFVVFNFIDRDPPRDQQSIIGWVTGDIFALRDRIVAHGGRLVGELQDLPEHGVRVQFAEDPEGALSENVQLL